MLRNITQALLSNSFLKVSSLIIGYFFWVIIAQSRITSTWIKIPLICNTNETTTIQAPESVMVEVKGKRSFLQCLDKKTLAAHINAQNLQPGTYTYILNSENIPLPSALMLTRSIPLNIAITVSKQLSTTDMQTL